MKRFGFGHGQGPAFCLAVAAIAYAGTTAARAQTSQELERTAQFAAKFQNPDGGFSATANGPSTLGATSSAARVLKYTGGAIPDVLAAIQYIKSCVDPASGGFATKPGGKADVPTTASGLMAMGELKIKDDAAVSAALGFLEANAKTFEEVRIAVAGFEAVKKTSPVFQQWAKVVKEGANGDGTFGSGPGKARETGGKAVALIRMGLPVENKDAVTAFLKSAQRPDGAWSKGDEGSELESTYRIMRYFFMTRQTPDLETLRTFVASCRHDDGSYGVKPGASGSGGTYFASVILYWSRVLRGEPAFTETVGFKPLFNGKDLDGWEGDTSLWSARDGMLVGSSPGIKNNNFLAHKDTLGSFVLKLNFQLVNGEGNSGVQFRSVRVPGHEMSGYQADIGQGYWGCLYDESRRNRVLVPASEAATKALHKDGWNHYVVDAKGPNIRLALNGPTSVQYKETDDAIARDGRVAVQIHAGGPMEVRFKDVLVQRVPEPDACPDPQPGFHLRTLKAEGGDRKYTVYIPREYDGVKPLPVVLFLHGSGERGEDGITQAQTGLGPAILNNPEAFPAIAVFPQARKTWAAGSDDAKAALAALDAVMKENHGDPRRVILTGLSMGGHGAWTIAAAEPERFAAVVPVCGRGDVKSAKTLATLPTWTVVGDADSDATVWNSREMVTAIKAAGGTPKYTEYRGVPHNSWDRAYNNLPVIRWMLSQDRR